VPRHVVRLVTRLVVDYFTSAARPGASARRAARRRLLRLRRASGCFDTSRCSSHGSSLTTSPPPRVRVPRLIAQLIVDYFVYAVCPVASATPRGTSRGSSRRWSSTTSPPPRVRVPRHVARLVMRLVVDYFTSTVRPGASARRTARCRLLQLRRASGCFGTSRGFSRNSSSTTSPRAGSSSTTSPTPCVRVPRHVARLVTQLVIDYFASATRPGASARCVARRRLLRLRRVSGCFGTLTTSPPSCVRVPRLVMWLVVDYFTSVVRPGASARCAARRRLLRLRRASGCFVTSRGTSRGSSRRSSSTTSTRAGSSSTTSPPPHVRVPQHVAWLVVDYFDYAARPVASARRAARRVARRQLLHLCRASGCLGSSRGSSSTTSTMPRVRLLRHVARLVVDYFALRGLVVDYFAYAARSGASASCAARLTVRRRLFHLHRASGCLGTSRGSSHGSSSTTPCSATSSCGHTGSTSATPCVATTCLVETLALLQLRRAPPRRLLLVASCRPFISTSFPN
jgi:hypothetical protein